MAIPEGAVKVLDHGYVRFIEKLGNDTRIVNSARASFAKQVDELGEKDIKLINYLLKNDEYAPLRHSVMTFEVYAPLMVARQWWKYSVSSTHREEQLAWSESSRRYLTEEPVFYIPNKNEWRTAPDNKKQGSGVNMPAHTQDGLGNNETTGAYWTSKLDQYVKLGEEFYEWAMESGMAPEQARLFLPSYGMYVRWYYTASLESLLHFLKERLEHKAQYEIQVYAQAVNEIVKKEFPETYKLWCENADI